ncbi:hypothetical protein QZM46_26515 [Burkholderia vietnamiensis]|jgi:hypothetical protein|uniref:Uncharacterized protein n=2 Tax=Burkholderia cepacia complex TaxID=87882 RepID=A0AA44Y016_BURVI|nr:MULTISPECIES: hypothetical protein [Burkholderia]AXK68265.1 hypothetical protein DCN14_37470 [Burkholderia sp. IDO3]KVR74414.1 hypothetical protein WK24_07380 [Burkholderia vietnamiensis]KVS03085.1 hypothetical protein WK29_27655 [Burkholderia vietnamiensis]MBH9647802.1 hypothetical protein [Burkholderia vietnamiensis]MBR7912043.1 hypothetical protein [Burkholderia vietnamiensis]
MFIDREEAKREEAWSRAWRDAARALGVDVDTGDRNVLDLIWEEAEKDMNAQRIPLPKFASVSETA